MTSRDIFQIDFLLLYRLCRRLNYVKNRIRKMPSSCSSVVDKQACCKRLMKTFLECLFKEYARIVSFKGNRISVSFYDNLRQKIFSSSDYTNVRCLLYTKHITFDYFGITYSVVNNFVFFKMALDLLEAKELLVNMLNGKEDKKEGLKNELEEESVENKIEIPVVNNSIPLPKMPTDQEQFDIALKKYLERVRA